MKKKNYLHLLAFAMVAMLSVCFVSCGDDDDNGGGSGGGIAGYWVRESHLNNPQLGSGGGTVSSYGYRFLSDTKVQVFTLHHTGLGSRYSYAEADTSWEKLVERNGVSFYMDPNYRTYSCVRADDEVLIEMGDNYVLMTIVGANRMDATSLDGYTEGAYIRIK